VVGPDRPRDAAMVIAMSAAQHMLDQIQSLD
jgi:hypothetical protein